MHPRGTRDATIHDARRYSIPLDAGELRQLAAEWPVLTCGNGIRQGEEGCDDGNVASGDGCDQGCRIESGFVCRSGNLEAESSDYCMEGAYNIFTSLKLIFFHNS